jgi:hypothetical protein
MYTFKQTDKNRLIHELNESIYDEKQSRIRTRIPITEYKFILKQGNKKINTL